MIFSDIQELYVTDLRMFRQTIVNRVSLVDRKLRGMKPLRRVPYLISDCATRSARSLTLSSVPGGGRRNSSVACVVMNGTVKSTTWRRASVINVGAAAMFAFCHAQHTASVDTKYRVVETAADMHWIRHVVLDI